MTNKRGVGLFIITLLSAIVLIPIITGILLATLIATNSQTYIIIVILTALLLWMLIGAYAYI